MHLDLSGYDLVSTIGKVEVERLGRAVGAARERHGLSGEPVATGGVDRLALIAGFSPKAAMSLSAATLIHEIQSHGYRVVLCSTCPDPSPLTSHPAVPLDLDELTILRRPNLGYDFGSWSVAMDFCGSLLSADKMLVLNDSLIGPFTSLADALADFEATSADVWGLVESGQVTDHLQSFFRGFRYGALTEPAMRSWWAGIKIIDDKSDLIRAYEYEFAPWLREHHFSSDYYVDFRGMVGRRQNPTIAGWRQLLAAGVPFLKRELVRRPELVPDGPEIPQVLLDRYGVRLAEWL